MQNPFDSFDAIYCINLDRRTDRWEKVQKEFAKVGIKDKVMRFGAIETPENGHIGCMLSHRAIIQKAKNEGWKNVLVFEDDIFFRKNLSYFQKIFQELTSMRQHWYLFYFGGFLSPFKKTKSNPINHYLATVSHIHCTHAIIYSSKIYDFFLANVPDNTIESIKFIEQWKYFDAWLASIQKSHTTFMCRNFSVFQYRKMSDTDGNNSLQSYLRQYFYLFYKFPILYYILFPIVKIKHVFLKK